MRALWIRQPGPPEVLEVREVPDPVPGPDEVLVRVRAAGVNRADLLQRRGLYPPPPGVPVEIPGLELAGQVAECGARVRAFRPGDRVMALVPGAAQAELAAVDASLCAPIPEGLGFEEAAAIPEAFVTAHDALVVQGGLRPGEVVLVTAAASGVGTAAVQLAREAGARVYGTSRTPAKRQRLAELGVPAVDPAQEETLRDRPELRERGGLDVILDLAGGPGLAIRIGLLAPKGRLVLVGLVAGRSAELDLGALLARRARLQGTVLRGRSLHERAAAVEAFARECVPLIRAGRLRPVIHAVLDLEQAAQAHRMAEANENFGKIVLRVSG